MVLFVRYPKAVATVEEKSFVSSGTSLMAADGEDLQAYCLFRVVQRSANQHKQDVGVGLSSTPPKSLPAVVTSELKTELLIELSNLPESIEKSVKSYVQHKLSRGSYTQNVFPSYQGESEEETAFSGQISILPINQQENPRTSVGANTLCYSGMFALDTKKMDRIEPEEGGRYSCYILCLVSHVEDDEGFALFRADLDLFCNRVGEQLYQIKMGSTSMQLLDDYLSSWHSFSIGYVVRCVNLLGVDTLATLLYHIYMSGSITVLTAMTKEKLADKTTLGSQKVFLEDICRAVDPAAMTHHNMMSSVQLQIRHVEEQPNDGNGISLSMDDQYKIHMDKSNTNLFCMERSRMLHKSVQSKKGATYLRHVMEDAKSKVLEDFNRLKRMVEAAKLNNYALYKAYRFMLKSENGDVITELLRSQKSKAGDAAASEVLRIIRNGNESMSEAPQYSNESSYISSRCWTGLTKGK
ncbi:hypothetical protein PROFUN_04769 [Planoprotostelium fungivorum]|uniref:Uncharacterized protein n=1 Tax=Planoprotostelium fungivorum TaxID=1890364 RepID=A0A2P6NST8_9EUKA|nr:hypothetical protein PROFUN_04769 [Planoprotostelium fungivorum]